jgi:hypothetical protein
MSLIRLPVCAAFTFPRLADGESAVSRGEEPTMSCEAIAAAAFLWLAASAPVAQPAAAGVAAPASVAQEPLFADIVRRAGALKAEVEAVRAGKALDLAGFSGRIGELAQLDMQGHRLLAQRGTDGDLKCILRGIAEDLPVKLKDVEAAADARARDLAFREMAYLLNDNVEVITSPPAAPVSPSI